MSRQCSRLSYLQVIPLASRLPLPRRFHLEDHRSSLRSNPSCSLPVSQAVNHPCNQTDNQLLNLLVSHEDNHPATNTETCSSTNILTCRYSSNAAHHSTKSAPFFVTNISTVSSFSFAVHQLPSRHDAHSHNRRGNPQHNLTMQPCHAPSSQPRSGPTAQPSLLFCTLPQATNQFAG